MLIRSFIRRCELGLRLKTESKNRTKEQVKIVIKVDQIPIFLNGSYFCVIDFIIVSL